jgi:drug/metabolite transporter (DMT)-like permease
MKHNSLLSLLPFDARMLFKPSSMLPLSVDVHTFAAVVGWFVFNISIANVNKWIFTNYDFRYPVFLTLIHMVCSMILSAISIRGGWYPLKEIPTWSKWCQKILPLAVIFCASIVAGNIGLKYIFVSYAQIITATTPLFTVIVTRIMCPNSTMKWEIYLSMLPIAGGVGLASWQEADFNLFGCLAIIVATALRAVKSVWQGILMSDEEDRLDALSLLYYMSPPCFGFLFVLCVVSEPELMLNSQALLDVFSNSGLLFWLWISGVVAFVLNIMNLLVTKYTSAVTLQVLGNVKVVLSIIVSVIIFQNKVSFLSWIGCAVTLVGVNWYSVASKR